MGALVVECRSDPRRGSVPARFGWTGRMREIAEVVDSWDGEDHCYFRVVTGDGAIYILRHDLSADDWELHFFRTGSDFA